MQVLHSLEGRLRTVLSQPDLRRALHAEPLKAEVLCLLDCMCGVTEATRVDNVQMLFDFLHPVLVEAVRLLGMYTSLLHSKCTWIYCAWSKDLYFPF